MMRGKWVTAIAAGAALIGWAGLALQLVLIVGNLGPALGAWRFIGFFTILANIGAALVASAIALGGASVLAGPRARLVAGTSILMVGVIYSVALRALWQPTGWQKVADIALHDATPWLWLLLWSLAPHPGLKWREVGWALLPGALYALYAFARGAVDGWYAYWFFDPSKQSTSELLVTVMVMLCAFAVMAAALVAVDRWLGRRNLAA